MNETQGELSEYELELLEMQRELDLLQQSNESVKKIEEVFISQKQEIIKNNSSTPASPSNETSNNLQTLAEIDALLSEIMEKQGVNLQEILKNSENDDIGKITGPIVQDTSNIDKISSPTPDEIDEKIQFASFNTDYNLKSISKPYITELIESLPDRANDILSEESHSLVTTESIDLIDEEIEEFKKGNDSLEIEYTYHDNNEKAEEFISKINENIENNENSEFLSSNIDLSTEKDHTYLDYKQNSELIINGKIIQNSNETQLNEMPSITSSLKDSPLHESITKEILPIEQKSHIDEPSVPELKVETDINIDDDFPLIIEGEKLIIEHVYETNLTESEIRDSKFNFEKDKLLKNRRQVENFISKISDLNSKNVLLADQTTKNIILQFNHQKNEIIQLKKENENLKLKLISSLNGEQIPIQDLLNSIQNNSNQNNQNELIQQIDLLKKKNEELINKNNSLENQLNNVKSNLNRFEELKSNLLILQTKNSEYEFKIKELEQEINVSTK